MYSYRHLRHLCKIYCSLFLDTSCQTDYLGDGFVITQYYSCERYMPCVNNVSRNNFVLYLCIGHIKEYCCADIVLESFPWK